MALNDSKKKTRSMSQNFKEYKSYEKEDNLNAMQCRFESNRILTAVKETEHTVITADGNVIHKKLASTPLNFQPSKKSEEARKPANRCRRCGRFSEDEYYETVAESSSKTGQQQDETSTSKSFPKLSMREQEKYIVITITTDSQSTDGEKSAHHEENNPETGEAAEIDGNIYISPPTTATSQTLTAQTPMPTSPIGCSTAHSVRTNG